MLFFIITESKIILEANAKHRQYVVKLKKSEWWDWTLEWISVDILIKLIVLQAVNQQQRRNIYFTDS